MALACMRVWAAFCRSQLRASEEHRTRLQTTVKDLKRDFQRTLNGTMFAATGPVS